MQLLFALVVSFARGRCVAYRNQLEAIKWYYVCHAPFGRTTSRGVPYHGTPYIRGGTVRYGLGGAEPCSLQNRNPNRTPTLQAVRPRYGRHPTRPSPHFDVHMAIAVPSTAVYRD